VAFRECPSRSQKGKRKAGKWGKTYIRRMMERKEAKTEITNLRK
jgi:hypothetical protein